jgi:NAD(P)-dependent dehydrogenase (short-subunit alcohol dehydrogenase family)
MQKSGPKKRLRKPQHQNRPGSEYKMQPSPEYDDKTYRASGKLNGKVAVITGGDSGIGRAVAILFAKEGADIAVIYLNEHVDAGETKRIVEEYGQKCFLIASDISVESNCAEAIRKIHDTYKKIDILVNNAAVHYESEGLEKITTEHLQRTFTTNVFSFFWITKFALRYMEDGGSIINTTSVTAYRGSGGLIDYASTKGAIVSFTRSLSANLVDRKIRVNAVAPGPIWTPLIVSSFKPDKVSKFGSEVPMKRAGQPYEVATAFLFLACNDSSYITGQVIHPNGGEIVNA